jgi:uncharacterized membrane protein
MMDKIKNSKLYNVWNKIINLRFIRIIFQFLPHDPIVFLLLIMSIITLIKFNIYSANEYVSVFEQFDVSSNIGPITEKIQVDLDFLESDVEFSNICFRVGTYERENDLDMTFSVENGESILLQETISTSKIEDYSLMCFDAGNFSLEELKNNDIFLSPSDNVSSTNAITIFQGADGNLDVALVRVQNSNLKYFSLICFIAFIGVFLIINYFINKKKLKENNFLILLLIYIMPILFIVPPYQVPDEPAHFYRAYHLSEYNFNDSVYDNLVNKELSVPSNVGCINYTLIQTADRVESLSDIGSCLKSSDNKIIENSNVGTGSIFGYIVPAIAIKIADIFTNSPLIIFYVGRIFNFSLSFYLLYLAVKIAPRHKKLFLIVGTMMMFIQQMISYSYDSLLNSLVLIYIAYILKLIYGNRKVKWKDWFLLIIVLFIVNNIKKLVYLPLALFLLFIPKDKFKNKRQKYMAIILNIIIILLLLKLTNMLVNLGYNGSNVLESASTGSSSGDQLSYLLNNPLDILKISLNTIKLKGMFYLNGIVGYFGWFKFKISDKYILVYLLLFIYVILGEKSNLKVNDRIKILLGVILSISLICFAMYIYWSDYMLLYVEGVQGRYFIPLLLPLALVFISKNNKYNIDSKIVYSVINILLLQYVLTLVLWYY